MQEKLIDLVFIFSGGVIHDVFQGIMDVAAFIVVVEVNIAIGSRNPNGKMCWVLNFAIEISNTKNVAVVLVIIVKAGVTVASSLDSKYMFSACHPDNHILVGPGFFSIEVDAPLDELARSVDELG